MKLIKKIGILTYSPDKKMLEQNRIKNEKFTLY